MHVDLRLRYAAVSLVYKYENGVCLDETTVSIVGMHVDLRLRYAGM